jgi:hypothetical protein
VRSLLSIPSALSINPLPGRDADFRQDPYGQDYHPRGGVVRHHRQCKDQDPRSVRQLPAIPSMTCSDMKQTRRASHPTSSVSSSPASSSRTAAPSQTTTSRRSRHYILSSVCVAVPRSARRRSTPRRRRSSTSARRPSLLCSSTTRWTVMARLSACDASVLRRRYVLYFRRGWRLSSQESLLISDIVRCRCLHGCHAQSPVLRPLPLDLCLRRV